MKRSCQNFPIISDYMSPTYFSWLTFTRSYADTCVLPFAISQVLNIDTSHNGNEFAFHCVGNPRYYNIGLEYIFRTLLP